MFTPSRAFYILLLFFLSVACKKDYSFNPESTMGTGTATFIKKCELIQAYSTYARVRLEFITFDGVQSSDSYSNTSFAGRDDEYHNTFTESLTGYTEPASTNIEGYNNLIIVNTDNLSWLYRKAPGFYLERYFNMIENDPVNATGIAAYGESTSNQIEIYREFENSDMFSNSADFNSSTFYDITRTNQTNDYNQDYDDNSISFSSTISILDEALDILHTYATPGKKQAITMFVSGNYESHLDNDILMNDLIDKSRLYNIPIHFISENIWGNDLKLAHLSGGFFHYNKQCESNGNDEVEFNCNELGNLETGVILKNLHNILTGNYTSHIIELTLSTDNPSDFASEEILQSSLLYNGIIHRFAIRKTP